jgi:8-oxo-dGTP pyrophosphatase MutT (NUDIX family)
MHVRLPVTAHNFLIKDGQVLMLRRFNTGYEDGNYSVVAGHLDGDETLVAAAIREIEEEVGVKVLPENIAVVGVMHRKSDDERVDFFLATETWLGEPSNREPDKCDDLGWYAFDVLPVNTIPYVRKALQNYCQGVWFDEFGW